MFRRFRYKNENGEWKRKWKKRYTDDEGNVRFIDCDRDSYRNQWTGPGYYKSAAKNAMRLARTEINMAYRTSEQERWRQFDFVVGYEVKTTQNGKHKEDICDQLAGKYPKDFKFTGWHPQCMCYTIPILKTEEEFMAYNPENPQKSANEITDVPQNFKDWIKDNKERIESAEKRGKLPYFIRDNREDVEEIMNPKIQKESQSISTRLPLPKLPKKPSQEEIHNFINILANNEGWFEQYEDGVSIILDEKLKGVYASASRENRIIYIKPSESVFNAFYRVSNGEELSFENANDLANLWHEINHMRHIGIDKATGGPYKGGVGTSAMELANEYYSRKTLPQFYKALGYEEIPFPNMKNRRNIGYNKMVELYDYVVKRKFGLDEEAVLKRIEYGLFNEPYNNQVLVLMDALKAGGLKAKDSQIEKLVLKMCQYGKDPTPIKLDELIDKMKYTVESTNASQYRGNLFARTLDNIQTHLISQQFKGMDSYEGLSEKASKLLSKVVGNDVRVNIDHTLMPLEVAKAHLTELLSITRDYKITQGRLTEINLGYSPKDKTEHGVTSFIPSTGEKKISLTDIIDKRDPRKAEENSRCDLSRIAFSLASHECGHLLLNFSAPTSLSFHIIRNEFQDIYREYLTEIADLFARNKTNELNHVSIGDYGTVEGVGDFMAECFQEYRNSSNPSKYARKIGKLIDRHFKK